MYLSEAITGRKLLYIFCTILPCDFCLLRYRNLFPIIVEFYQVICRVDLKLLPPTPQRPGEAITTLRGGQILSGIAQYLQYHGAGILGRGQREILPVPDLKFRGKSNTES